MSKRRSLGRAVELELFTHRFAAVAQQMGERLRRTAVSTNVKERLDFSCALLDPAGELVVNAPHIPVHLGALGLCVRRLREVMALEPGDVAVTNHPGFGGSHLPDVTHDQDSQDGEILAFLGQAQSQMGRPAFDLFEQAAQVAPDSVIVLTLYGQYLRQQGALKAAQIRFGQAATLDPENAAIFAEIAATKNELGHLNVAERWYQVAIQVAEDKMAFQLLLANFYANRNYQLKEAGLPLVEQLLKIEPNNPTIHHLHGWMLFLIGQPQEAEVALQKALSLNPDFIQARYHLARVLLVNGKPLDAAQAYQAVIDGDTQGGWRDLAQQAIKN